METIRKPTSATDSSIRERIDKLEREYDLKELKEDTKKKQKKWKMPGKWKRNLNKGRVGKKNAEDKVLVIYLNQKGEIEHPRLMPLYSGNIIIYKNKAYEFDPQATWLMKYSKKIIKCVIIREIDRRPVSNLDWYAVKKRGDATDSDEILVKMVKKAVIEKAKKQIKMGMWIVIVLLVVAAVAVFFFIKGK